jgi:RHS repeat-associated protein
MFFPGTVFLLLAIISNYESKYNPMGRLLTVTKDGSPIEEYQYGPNGTRPYEMNTLRGIAGRTMSYSDEDHLLTAGDTSYQYDLDGFLTNKTNGTNLTSYNYSSFGEMLRVTLPDGKVIEYIQDPFGRRIAKEVDGVIVEKYLWRDLTQLLAIYDGSDNLVMRFEYADGRMPASMTRGGSTYYLTYDQVGSLRAVEDALGNVVKRIDYDSFGNITNDSDSTFKIPFGFAGGLHDRDTGLVRFGFRDYDPDVGRWTAKDPIFFGGLDIDLYGYCVNDPVNLVDPWGLSWLVFYRGLGILLFYDREGHLQGFFEARNSTESGVDPWPVGTCPLIAHLQKKSDPCGRYGRHGFFHFDVKGRTEMGLHAGRDCPQYNPRGIEHPTGGCIRTTDSAMKFIKELHEKDPLEYIEVKRNVLPKIP